MAFGGFLLAAFVVVAILKARGILDLDLAYTLMGSFFGLGASVIHLPNAGGGRSHLEGRGFRCCVGAAIPAVSLAILIGQCTAADGMPNIKEMVNYFSCLLISLVFVVCLAKHHPPSCYVRDAMWSLAGVWTVLHMLAALYIAMRFMKSNDPEARERGQKAMSFFLGAAMHLEGVIFAWNACLMTRRVAVLEVADHCGSRRSPELIMLMAISFHCKMWTETMEKYMGNGALKTTVYVSFFAIFLAVWLFYVVVVSLAIARGVRLLHRESRCVRGAPRAEVIWASKVLTCELASCITIGFSTALLWSAISAFRLLKWTGGAKSESLVYVMVIGHRLDLVVNGISVALLSGLLWQVRGPSPEELKDKKRQLLTGMTMRSFDFSSLEADLPPPRPLPTPEWVKKVEELAGRGVRLRSLLEFWELLLDKEVMPSFEPMQSTTNDVVRQAIIPLSAESDESSGGRALASVWSGDASILPSCMVTHNWSNVFMHLVAGVFAEFLNEDCYEGVAALLLQGKAGCKQLALSIEQKGVLDSVVWICAFSINQHASICGGFGPAPNPNLDNYDEQLEEWQSKQLDTVTGEQFPLCECTETKAFNDQPDRCEINKFDDMMRYLAENVESFRHLVVVDAAFAVFSRAWCIAEVVESNVSGIPQRIKIHSQKVLDLHYESLSMIDVRKCRSSRPEDRNMILSNIPDVDAFNAQLQWAIFGTMGLLSRWVDGQERAAMIGRIVKRTKTVSTWASSGTSSQTASTISSASLV